jgi:hypothetical protein
MMATYPGSGTYKPTRATGTVGLRGNTAPPGASRPPAGPVDPYAGLPPVQPYDNSWYQRELDRMNQLARQAAAQAQASAAANSQQAADFAAQYIQQRNAMMPTERPRVSKGYWLGGY